MTEDIIDNADVTTGCQRGGRDGEVMWRGREISCAPRKVQKKGKKRESILHIVRVQSHSQVVTGV
jgi:hypothetical protein